MFQLPIPSLKSFKLFSWEKQAIDIPSVKVHDIENAQEKPARALKHLLKLNHANYAILYNGRKFHNHAPHVSFIGLLREGWDIWVLSWLTFLTAPQCCVLAGC